MRKENNTISSNEGSGIKEDILRALDGKKILLCPYCKHRVFIRKEFTKVEITEDGDGLLDNIVDSCWDDYEYRCAKCGEDVEVDDMIKTTKLVFNKDG